MHFRNQTSPIYIKLCCTKVETFQATLKKKVFFHHFAWFQIHVCWVGSYRMVDIKINAWSSIFLNLETNLILYLYPVKCLKFNQSELRIRSWEIKNFARHFRFMFRNRRDSLILKTGFWFFCLYPKKRVVNFSTFANPLYLLLTCAKFAILNLRPTSTWFYSCYMDMCPQRPAP